MKPLLIIASILLVVITTICLTTYVDHKDCTVITKDNMYNKTPNAYVLHNRCKLMFK